MVPEYLHINLGVLSARQVQMIENHVYDHENGLIGVITSIHHICIQYQDEISLNYSQSYRGSDRRRFKILQYLKSIYDNHDMSMWWDRERYFAPELFPFFASYVGGGLHETNIRIRHEEFEQFNILSLLYSLTIEYFTSR
jgi:hypothetical protein